MSFEKLDVESGKLEVGKVYLGFLLKKETVPIAQHGTGDRIIFKLLLQEKETKKSFSIFLPTQLSDEFHLLRVGLHTKVLKSEVEGEKDTFKTEIYQDSFDKINPRYLKAIKE